MCGSTTLGNLRASLAGYRDFSAVVMPTSTMGNDAPQNALNRQTLKGSEMATLLRDSVQHYGDHPVFFTDGFFRYGVALYPACAPNHDRPNALLVRAFSLVTGRDGPWAPIQLEHE
ncbi:hypothetical protein AXYL_06786 (plasmid) [Achromobacter xylosoxidans A8]|uniref:Uncharacterized protein n=1 Tax=Achromobacter xylosoxidans (strain A8) TaxID=762376 RepID=E3HYB4_ACHXA|nr:hypothetical protein AXYL_06786 [Achromobacter xylosoxidans A8]